MGRGTFVLKFQPCIPLDCNHPGHAYPLPSARGMQVSRHVGTGKEKNYDLLTPYEGDIGIKEIYFSNASSK